MTFNIWPHCFYCSYLTQVLLAPQLNILWPNKAQASKSVVSFFSRDSKLLEFRQISDGLYLFCKLGLNEVCYFYTVFYPLMKHPQCQTEKCLLKDCHTSDKNPGLTDISVRGVLRKRRMLFLLFSLPCPGHIFGLLPFYLYPFAVGLYATKQHEQICHLKPTST